MLARPLLNSCICVSKKPLSSYSNGLVYSNVKSPNEVTTIDNVSWICIHAYVVQSLVKVPILLQIEHIVNGSSSNNLTKVIIITLMRCGGLTMKDVSKKLLCFGVDGAFIFQGGK